MQNNFSRKPNTWCRACRARKAVRTVTEFLGARWGCGGLRLHVPGGAGAHAAAEGATWGGPGSDPMLTVRVRSEEHQTEVSSGLAHSASDAFSD